MYQYNILIVKRLNTDPPTVIVKKMLVKGVFSLREALATEQVLGRALGAAVRARTSLQLLGASLGVLAQHSLPVPKDLGQRPSLSCRHSASVFAEAPGGVGF